MNTRTAPGLLTRLHHLPRETRDTWFTLALIGWIVLPHVPQLPPWCTALVAVVLLWRGALALGQRPLPGRWLRVAMLGLICLGTFYSHGGLVGQEASVTLLVSLLALKSLELRARRDALVIFFLGFFTMLTGFIESQSLPMAATVLLGLLGLLTALINAHRPVGQPRLRESATLALRLMALGTPVMIALFVFFPRFAPLWAMPADPEKGRSGLSSTMTVGHVAELAMDESVAFRIKFDGEPPPQEQLYFRGPVLSHFDGREWTARGGGRGFEAMTAPPPRDLQLRGPGIAYELTLQPHHQPWLLTLDVAAERPDMPERWRPRQSGDLQWLAGRPVTELLRYRARSHPDFSYGQTGWDDKPRRDLGHYLALPAGFNPRTQALGRELAAQVDAQTPTSTREQALTQAALQRLRTGDYHYTLEPGLTGTHSADEFWFDTQAGFCEHIASAFVVLLRAADVPARIVTGFQGGERNSIDGYWVVRNADAHAWTEVWMSGHGWVRVDPTAAVMPGRLGLGQQYQRLRSPPGLVGNALTRLSPQLLARLRLRWDAINNRWNQWVLGHDQERQFELLRRLGFDQPNWVQLGQVLAALLVLATLVAWVWARWERTERDPWQRLLAQLRRRLQRTGVTVPAHAPPRHIAGLVAASDLPAPLRRALGHWLLALERQRYAPSGSPGQPSLATLKRQLRQLPWPPSPA